MREFYQTMQRPVEKAHRNDLLVSTSKEHLTSSTVGHIIRGSPRPRGILSSANPDDIEVASSVIHFSSSEPREENYKKARIQLNSTKFLLSGIKFTIPLAFSNIKQSIVSNNFSLVLYVMDIIRSTEMKRAKRSNYINLLFTSTLNYHIVNIPVKESSSIPDSQ